MKTTGYIVISDGTQMCKKGFIQTRHIRTNTGVSDNINDVSILLKHNTRALRNLRLIIL